MAVTANQVVKRQDGCRAKYPVAASTYIYEGTLVFVSSAGYGDDDTASGVNEFAGIAVSAVDNSSGSNGDLAAEVYTDGVFELTGTGFAQTDVGSKIYATDNYTITTTATGNGVLIGECTEYVSSTKLKVRIDPSLSEGVVTDSATLQTITFNGSTGGNEIRVTTNLADALSIEDTAGDLIVFDTTTGTQVITVTPSTTFSGGITIADAKNVVLDTTTGTKIGTAVGQKLGFWNVTPVVQPASANQAALGAVTTIGTNTGTAGAGMTLIADTSTGDRSAEIMNDFAAVQEDLSALFTLVAAIRTALVDSGIIKGAA